MLCMRILQVILYIINGKYWAPQNPVGPALPVETDPESQIRGHDIESHGFDYINSPFCNYIFFFTHCFLDHDQVKSLIILLYNDFLYLLQQLSHADMMVSAK